MTTTDLLPPCPFDVAVGQPDPVRRGPFVRIVVGSVVLGALAAAALVLGVFPGAVEHVTTGVTLLGFAAGWAMLAALTSRWTSSPQRWAYVPASFLGIAGLALVALAPGDDDLQVVGWVWPPAALALAAWCAHRARTSMPGRTRWLLHPVLTVLAVCSVGALVEDVGLQRDDNRLTMPGRLHEVGGHRLHLTCRGSGSPTVVLESGMGGSSPMWAPVADATAPTTRVCAYDRAGHGWSDEAARPQDSLAVTTDLHRLLEVAGETGPYVFAGHSVGGVYAMTYAARYPDQVAGLVLLDSASPRQFTALPDYPGQYATMTRLYGVAPTLARLGLGRLPALSGNEVPGEAGRQASAFASSPRSARTTRDELSTYRRAFTQAQALTTFGDKPLVVVTASASLAHIAGWAAAQQQLSALSTNASGRTVTSSHEGLLDQPGRFQTSVTAITDVVRAVREAGPVGTP